MKSGQNHDFVLYITFFIFSMVGANKNQSIHELLTNFHHLDKHKPYGGLSMIFAGDLKQLGKPPF